MVERQRRTRSPLDRNELRASNLTYKKAGYSGLFFVTFWIRIRFNELIVNLPYDKININF
jgi:hypothetical protein